MELAQVRALLEGYRTTGLLHAAAQFALADRLAQRSATATELASDAREAEGMHRLLRGLSLIGFCVEETDGCFSLGPLGEHFRTGAPGAMHEYALLCGEEYMPSWRGLARSVTTGESAYEHHFGLEPWERRKRVPEVGAWFDRWLAETTGGVSEQIARAYDFSRFATVADIAGGAGALLCDILRAHESVSGILFEHERSVEGARAFISAAGLRERCEIIAGDFFTSISAHADVLVLKSVLHDWSDEACDAILRACRAAGGRLLIVERILPARAADDAPATMLDLHMMAVTGGRERSLAEFRAMLERAGYAPGETRATSSGFHLIEGTPA